MRPFSRIVEHGRGVVVGVDPVADVLARAVELGADAVDDVGDLARDELLDVLPRAVVVGAVGHRRLHAEAADPRADQVVGAGLGRGVGRGRVVGRVLGEALGVVELEVAVDLVGRDVVEALVVLPHGLEDRVGAEDVGPDERARVVERVVVVRLRGVVHDRVVLGHQRVDHVVVGDVADHQLHAVLGQRRERLLAGGVGQLVEHRDAQVGVVDEVVHEVRPDEPRASGHEKAIHGAESRGGAISNDSATGRARRWCTSPRGRRASTVPSGRPVQPSGRSSTA